MEKAWSGCDAAGNLLGAKASEAILVPSSHLIRVLPSCHPSVHSPSHGSGCLGRPPLPWGAWLSLWSSLPGTDRPGGRHPLRTPWTPPHAPPLPGSLSTPCPGLAPPPGQSSEDRITWPRRETRPLREVRCGPEREEGALLLQTSSPPPPTPQGQASVSPLQARGRPSPAPTQHQPSHPPAAPPNFSTVK